MIDQQTRQTKLPARPLSSRVIEGLEKRASLSEIPVAKLPEIIQLRAIVRDLISHINHLEEVAGQKN